MRYLRITLAVTVLCSVMARAGDDELPPHVLNLARIQLRMAGDLNRLPNYTCLETIDRYTSVAGTQPKPLDRIRINVALVEGKELYSWPGSKSFEDRTLAEMVRSGFISDGDFASMAKNVFLHRNSTISFIGQQAEGGRTLLRYKFEISPMQSGWQIRLGGASGVVGAKGWFEADSTTYDLVRFQFEAVDLPPFSPEKGFEERAEYGRVRLGEADVLLPLSVDLKSEAFSGTRRWNHATFTACREYGAKTTISFNEEGSPAPAAAIPVTAKAEAVVSVPPGLEVSLRLDSEIDSARSAVGDEITAVVAKTVRIEKEVILQKGAVVKGVIRRFDRHVGNRPYCAVGLEFTEALSDGKSFLFFGKMDGISRFAGLHQRVIGFDTPADRASPGVGLFYVEGESFTIPQGVQFTWITEPVQTR